MDKKQRAKLLLIEIEGLAGEFENTRDLMVYANEVIRTAKALAEETIEDEKEAA